MDICSLQPALQGLVTDWIVWGRQKTYAAVISNRDKINHSIVTEENFDSHPN